MESRTTHQKKRRALRQPRARHGHSPRSPARASPARLGAVEVSARASAAVGAPSEGAFIRRRLLSLVAPAACPLTNSNLMPTPNHRLAPPRGRVMTCLSAHARRRPPPPTAAAAAAALRAPPRPQEAATSATHDDSKAAAAAAAAAVSGRPPASGELAHPRARASPRLAPRWHASWRRLLGGPRLPSGRPGPPVR